MEQSRKTLIISETHEPLAEYNKAYKDILETGSEIESILQADIERIPDIRRKFEELSNIVELEFQGIALFSQEIKKIKEYFQSSIREVHESLAISQRINNDLVQVAQSFEKVHAEGAQLEDAIKTITTVSDTLEVASRNAGITAYHAGRQARGFEVIAREMTALMRNVQGPIQEIPEVSNDIVTGTVTLSQDLARIGTMIESAQAINGQFSAVADELLALIPKIEQNMQRLSKSLKAQKMLHSVILQENEKARQWLDSIYDVARACAVMGISLEALFWYVNNVKDSLLAAADDDDNFARIYENLKIACANTSKMYSGKPVRAMSERAGEFDIESSGRSLHQLLSDSHELLSGIETINHDVEHWVKTNTSACEILMRGSACYRDIFTTFGVLKAKLSEVQDKARRIGRPLHDLQRITERSRILGLYAGIESARGEAFSPSLGLITHDIQELSQKSISFVEHLGDLGNDIAKRFTQLAMLLAKSIGDVEQGITYLGSGMAILEKNQKALENLDSLVKKMTYSTKAMTNGCDDVAHDIQRLGTDHEAIETAFDRYNASISASAQATDRVLGVLNRYARDISIARQSHTTLFFRQSVEPITFDPAHKTDARSHEVIEQIFIGLYTFDSAHHLVPGIAESFSVSHDGCVWDFALKNNVVFHNGDRVTAQDVLNTLQRVRQGPNRNFIDYIKDATVLDEQHLRVVLAFPYLPVIANLACGTCDITPHRFSPQAPVGAGPYRFVSSNGSKEIVLEAFDNFFDGRPAIDSIVMAVIPDDREAITRFKDGEISIMQLSPDMITAFERAEIISGPGLSTQYIGINVSQNTPFKHKKVRQALNYAIDKNYFAVNRMEGQALPAYGVYPPGMYVYNQNLSGYGYDVERAKMLMKEAGYGRGIDGSFTLDVSRSETAIKRAEYIKACLATIGITVEIQSLPWKEFLEKGYRGESILCMKSWVSDNGDPDNFLYPLFHSDSFGEPGNTSFYSNRVVDDTIEKARAERNSRKRIHLYQEVERMIVEDAPWVFLSHGVDSYVVQKNIHGFKVDPFGIVRFRFLWSS